MIWKKWIEDDSEDFSPYADIKLDESELREIVKIPYSILDKLFKITEAELWKKTIAWVISVEEARGALIYAKYLKNYFNK